MAKKTVRAILVGCGGMARAWVDGAKQSPQVQIVALVDLHRAAAEKFAAQQGFPPSMVFDNFQQALKHTDANAVFDVTIPAAHASVTLQALRAGCHVLGEKPMSDNLADARRMVAAAAKADRIYAVIQNRRYDPHIRAVRRVVQSGKLGAIEEIHSDFFLGPHFGGFRDQMDFPLIIDMAIHTFDAARYLSGADALAVTCHSFNPRRSWYRGDASAIAIFEMTDGVVYSYRGSWCAEGNATSWNSAWRLVCGNGSVLWDGETNIIAQRVERPNGAPFSRDTSNVPVPIKTLSHQRHAGLIRDFAAAVRTGKPPLTHCQDNIRSLAMVLAAVKSAQSNRRVKVQW